MMGVVIDMTNVLMCPVQQVETEFNLSKVPGLHVTCSLLVLLRAVLISNVHYTSWLC